MTTRNFRVNNGLEVGDITISANANTITGGATAAPNADGQFANKKYVDDSISAVSTVAITQNNSNVTVTDSGTGKIEVTADGTEVADFAVAATTITATGNINLTAGADVAIPNNIGLLMGSGGEKIESDGTNLTLTSTGALTLTATGETVVTNNMRIAGNLTVDGTETIVNTTTLSIEDNIIEVNRNVSANSGMPSLSGLKVNRGDASSATENDLYWVWDETFADDGTTVFGGAGGAFTAGRGMNPGDIDALVDIRCNVVHATATSAQYADVAERFEADAPMSAGAVVEVGGDAEITETTSEMSENVFGVISDQPAYAMNAAAGNNDSHPFVAMTGRTPVRVTGLVTKGQRLVTSSVKGCARAVATGESISPFNVIGRALESSTDAGIKLVNCAVRTNN